MSGSISITQVPGDPDRLALIADFPHLTPQGLFEYFTVPELLESWWAQRAETDPRLGGAYRLLWPGKGWELTGVYTRFEPGQVLGFTWRWTHLPDLPERSVEIIIHPAGEGCQAALTQGTYTSSPADIEDRQSHLEGWLTFFGRLQALSNGDE